jgi:hypothetical protein
MAAQRLGQGIVTRRRQAAQIIPHALAQSGIHLEHWLSQVAQEMRLAALVGWPSANKPSSPR